MRKLGLELESEWGQSTLGQPMSDRLQSAPTDIMGIPRTLARLTGITGLITLQGACLSARVHGSTDSTVGAATITVMATMADGATMVPVDGMEMAAGMAAMDGTVKVGSTETQASTAVVSREAASTVATWLTVVADSMAEVASTGEATGSRESVFRSQWNGWRPESPAVFFCARF